MNESDRMLERRLAALGELAEPSASDKARVLAGVRARLALPEPSASDVPAPLHGMSGKRSPANGNGRAGLRRLGPWLGGGVIGGVLGLALGFGISRTPGDPARVFDAPTPAERREPTPVAGAEPVAVPAPSAPPPPDASRSQAQSRPRTAPLRAAPRRQTFGLSDALELLHQAERALHASDPVVALGLLGDLDRRAQRSMLRQERLTTLVLALCQLGRGTEARAVRDELHTEFEGSIYFRRLERSCATEIDAP